MKITSDACGHLARRRRDRRAPCRPAARAFSGDPVVDRGLVAGGDQVPAHRRAHDPGADPADPRLARPELECHVTLQRQLPAKLGYAAEGPSGASPTSSFLERRSPRASRILVSALDYSEPGGTDETRLRGPPFRPRGIARPGHDPARDSMQKLTDPDVSRPQAGRGHRAGVPGLPRQPRDRGRGRPRGGPVDRPGAGRPEAQHQADRQRELLVAGDPVRHGQPADRQVRRGHPPPPVLRRLRQRRLGRGPGQRPRPRALRRRPRLCPAPQRRRRESRRLLGHPPGPRRAARDGQAPRRGGPRRLAPADWYKLSIAQWNQVRQSSATSACSGWSSPRAGT